MLIAHAFSEYLANFKTSLVFGLLLVFAPIAFFLSTTFIGSGTVFIDYNLSIASPVQLVLALAFAVFYLVFFSFFVSIIIFSVKKDLSTLHFNYYLSEMIQKFTIKIFEFYVLLFFILFIIGSVLFLFSVPVIITTIILLLVSIGFLFVPQAIVIDEESLLYSVYNNFEFLRKNFSSFAYVAVAAIILLGIIQLIEFGLDQITSIGPYVTIVLSLVFLVPYIEVMKTYLYMLKYDLIKNPDLLRRNAMKKKRK